MHSEVGSFAVEAQAAPKRKSKGAWAYVLGLLLVEAAWIGAIITGIVWVTRV